MQTTILNRIDIKDLLNMREVVSVVENAFREWSQGKGNMPAKAYLAVEQGDFRAMPASLPGAVGMKWVNVHPKNPPRGLPSGMAILIYNDVETGYHR